MSYLTLLACLRVSFATAQQGATPSADEHADLKLLKDEDAAPQ